MKNTNAWLKPFCESVPDQQIVELCTDSRHIGPGMCFIALPGAEQDGRRYIAEALAQGAVLVLAEQDEHWVDSADRRVIGIPKLRQQLGRLAASFYGSAASSCHITAITGTNGKSTCTHWLAQLYQALKQPVWFWSTVGFGGPGHLQPSQQTTPDPLTLHRLLAVHGQANTQVVLETSSHALTQYRLDGLPIDVAVLTNFSHEHLDYHGSMIAYAAAKSRLFTELNPDIVVLNYDDPLGQQLQQMLRSSQRVHTYGSQRGAEVQARMVELSTDGIEITIQSPWGDCTIGLPFYGYFNAYNLLAVFTVLAAQGIPVSAIEAAAAQLIEVPGRMQRLGGGSWPDIFIDYAHTPDALRQALQSIRQHGFTSVGCVFGSGGRRDRSKRAMMGQVAEAGADWLILTNDNPRDEDPQQIIEDILQGITDLQPVQIELDRRQALAKALMQSKPGEAILVAGKGHETVQWLGSGPKPFADYSTIMALLADR